MTSTTFFIIFIPILAILLLAINLVLAPHNPYQEKDSVFECGFHSFLGQNRTQFSVSFFIFALLFLLFDLEILLVYPYSVSGYNNDIYGLVIMMIFFILLTLGFVFELGKNALTIDSKQTFTYTNEDASKPDVFISFSLISNTFRSSTWSVELFSYYFIWFTDKCHSFLEWTWHNAPQPHAFTNIPLQSNPNWELTREAMDNYNNLMKRYEEGQILTQIEYRCVLNHLDNMTEKFSIEKNNLTCSPEYRVRMQDNFYRSTSLKSKLLRDILQQYPNFTNYLVPIFLPFSILELPFIAAVVRIIIYTLASYVDLLVIPLIAVVESLLPVYKLYKLPSRIRRIILLLNMISNYIKKNKKVLFIYSILLGMFAFCYKSLNTFIINCDAPRAWGLYFQDSASPQMEALVELHDNIMYYLVAILFAVGWIQAAIIRNFESSKSPISNKYLNHGTLIELIWTITPALILVLIAFPSFKLLYLMDEVTDPSLSVLAEGHQWYWSYEYPDFLNSDGDFIEFDSYLVPESDLEEGSLRMLEVDNRVILPEITHTRFILTAADVIHSFAIPALGVKCDAYPGRLNQFSVLINRLGTFYGQCSEICGILHSSMPIVVESVPLVKFLSWLQEQ